MDFLDPVRRLNKVDFPTFGRPIMATSGDDIGFDSTDGRRTLQASDLMGYIQMARPRRERTHYCSSGILLVLIFFSCDSCVSWFGFKKSGNHESHESHEKREPPRQPKRLPSSSLPPNTDVVQLCYNREASQ